ncbi:TPM domain-containing protein [Limibacter armeniacum]|uniref:TPM domain-containing protein n=1 Tax=Limibacter armeniacum TaxID=466084 RepID=UPI002FE5CCCF
MKNLPEKLLCILLIATQLFVISLTQAQDFPKRPNPPKLVNDLAEMLIPADRSRLERKLVDYNDTTSTQIAIVTVTSIGGYDISDYTFQLGEKWGIGQQEKDNGILVLIAKNERKTFIATGYGIEAYIPDIYAKRIVDQVFIPNFKEGDYYKGLDKGTDIMIDLLDGKFQAMPSQTPQIPLWIPIAFIIGVFILMALMKRGMHGKHIPTRTIGGSRGIPPTWIDFSNGRGRFGNRGGFGNSGGGGFGGFGGGGFGGGGAGGSW